VSAFREAVWADVGDGALPEAFAQRRAWLLAQVPPHAKVLDLGCGDGAFAAELVASGADVVGVDVAQGAVERARARVPRAEFHAVGEGEALPVANGWADVVWAGEVLEHLVDVSGVLAEVRLALRPGGMLVATTPAHGPLLTRTSRLDPRSDHLRFFTRRSLQSVLADDFRNVTVRRRRGRLFACAS
jgi:2-polyprenyl-3-methyl-5-hydroxy-6-metoxy-1,4-benzoquinol methylase